MHDAIAIFERDKQKIGFYVSGEEHLQISISGSSSGGEDENSSNAAASSRGELTFDEAEKLHLILGTWLTAPERAVLRARETALALGVGVDDEIGEQQSIRSCAASGFPELLREALEKMSLANEIIDPYQAGDSDYTPDGDNSFAGDLIRRIETALEPPGK